VGLIIYVLGKSYTWILHDRFFSLDSIHICQPNGALLPIVHQRKILSELNIQLGTPLYQLNMDEMAQHVRNYPWVKSAVIQRRWPNKLIVWAELHYPRLLVALDNVWVASTEAEIFKPLHSHDDLVLPVVTGLEPYKKKGTQVLMHLLQRVLRFLDYVEQHAQELGLIEEIHWDEGLGFSLRSKGALAPYGVTLHLGLQPEKRLTIALTCLKWITKEKRNWASTIWAGGEKHPERIGIRMMQKRAVSVIKPLDMSMTMTRNVWHKNLN
jgi:hypothetical protein